jgi:hypothetical protein
MTLDEVRSLVRAQSMQSLSTTNEHRITLANALVPPKALTVIWRTTKNGRLRDEELQVWLVGQESSPDGYKIIVRDDGQQLVSHRVAFQVTSISFWLDGTVLSSPHSWPCRQQSN